jgi:hypothetical protein
MRLRGVSAAICAVLASGAIAACGSSGASSSSNGVAAKSPEAILAATYASIKGVKSLRIYGSLSSEGLPVTLDLNLVAGEGASGSMSEHGLSFKLIAVGKTIYIQGSKAFWTQYGGAAAATLFKGRWLKASLSTGSFASLYALTNANELFAKLLGSHGPLVKVAETTIGGQKVVGVHDTTKGGTLYVAVNGPAYPVELVANGVGKGHVSFGDFNQTTSVTAPSSSIDVSQLKG